MVRVVSWEASMVPNILLGTLMMIVTTAVVMAVVQRSFAKVLEHIHRKKDPSAT
jgi:hypothetical protein